MQSRSPAFVDAISATNKAKQEVESLIEPAFISHEISPLSLSRRGLTSNFAIYDIARSQVIFEQDTLEYREMSIS